MIKGLLHALVSRPVVYSVCQRTIGAGQVTQRIAEYVPSGYSRALDIGSGRGYAGRMWPREADYIPLDIDRAMLRAGGCRLAVQSEATELPLVDNSIDMVLCKQVSHHISEEHLDRLFAEIQRVLRPDGRLLFMDAVRTDRAVSNLLWRYDRGAHPRPESDLLRHLQPHFTVLQREAHWNLHLYLLFLLAPTAPSGAAAVTRPSAAVRAQT
jgi:SAM-dependent methyltransferase